VSSRSVSFCCRLVSEILRESGDATEVELTRDGKWHITKTEDFDCPSPEQPSVVQNVMHGECCTVHHTVWSISSKPSDVCACAVVVRVETHYVSSDVKIM